MAADSRAVTNPLYNDNRLKLGIFATNARGTNMTTLPDVEPLTWSWMVRVAQRADEMGFEAIVPFARWKMSAATRARAASDGVYDPYIWAAGLGQATRHAAILATSHVPMMHPIVVAKQAATIDQITGGRFGLNVVAGWNAPEFAMFGSPLVEHDARYDQAAEWLGILKRLWTEKEFDHEGPSYRIVRGESHPKPVQLPYPPIMNAGGSERGRQFAIEHADLCFLIAKSNDPAALGPELTEYRALAAGHAKTLQMWTYAYVIQRDSQDEAEAYEQLLVDNANQQALASFLKQQNEQSELMPEAALAAMSRRWICGGGGFPLVGTVETIARKLEALSRAGLDGLLLTWFDYLDGLDRWNRDVMPLLESAGLRKRYPT